MGLAARLQMKPSAKTAVAQARSAPREEIARVAYELFERRGGLHGHDLQDWFTAERIVRERLQGRRGG